MSTSDDFHNGLHIDKIPDCCVKEAPSFCKDVGIKQSFQGLGLCAINHMLGCYHLSDFLSRGFVSASGFLLNWMYYQHEKI